jgi:uncharacterized protein (TIGR03435 family)
MRSNLNLFGIRGKIFRGAAGLAVIAAQVAFVLGSATVTTAPSQAQDKAASAVEFKYDVVSIKPSRPGSGNSMLRGGVQYTPDGFTASNITAISLIQSAYGVGSDRISGAQGWAISDAFDVQAKLDSSVVEALNKLSADERELAREKMLQAILADRFKLTIHNGSKEHSSYSLVIAKSGPKLKEGKPGDTYDDGIKGTGGRGLGGDMMIMRKGLIRAQGILMETLAQALTRQLDRPVVDKTGLTGRYDFTLQWAVEQNQAQPPRGDASDGSAPPLSPDASGPSLFTALQEQLGLKLEGGRDPIQFIFIDHIEKPSRN